MTLSSSLNVKFEKVFLKIEFCFYIDTDDTLAWLISITQFNF